MHWYLLGFFYLVRMLFSCYLVFFHNCNRFLVNSTFDSCLVAMHLAAASIWAVIQFSYLSYFHIHMCFIYLPQSIEFFLSCSLFIAYATIDKWGLVISWSSNCLFLVFPLAQVNLYQDDSLIGRYSFKSVYLTVQSAIYPLLGNNIYNLAVF